MKRFLTLALCIAALPRSLPGGTPAPGQTFVIDNGKVSCTVNVEGGHLASDILAIDGKKAPFPAVETDAGFLLEVMWSEWRFPGAKNNAENPVLLGAADFTIEGSDTVSGGGRDKYLNLYFAGPERALHVRVTYRLGLSDMYVRRSIAVRDSARAGHLLRMLWGRDCLLPGNPAVVKEGGFGQPVALKYGNAAGAFFGLEYPASQNDLIREKGSLRLRAGQEFGVKVDSPWCVGTPVVECITADTSVRKWFWEYVNDIRVAPLRPYTLYNSWYDLRSPAFKNIPPGNVMNEANIMRIIGLIDRNMIEKHGIMLDAFVLDDGWDVYGSDWALRSREFPRGLKPIADELRKTGTGLGLWLGPTGGYSFHGERISWMKSHGYEIVDNQLCLAGAKYSALFRKRVEDFVRNDGVSFFKWDGIQFACNEPDHGHPIDIYSRRAVVESVIDKCNAVRKANPATYLNITSGTWLSPWWLQYANQIWMDGQDYGYADVPSISPRDAAITYRDFVLYDDLRTKDLWFPVANMMTHGIIKGNLEKLGGENEPLDRFTNEALLYFARGVSMWELYISPDILSDGEWDAMAEAMQWARDRFPVLSTTTMIGGDPKARETYGYVHFKGEEGVIAARNPSIDPGQLTVSLSPSLGLESGSDSLVLERVYPSRWIMPRLYCAGSSVTLSLDRYETAVYEVYPLKNAARPLIAGVLFDAGGVRGNVSRFSCYPIPGTNARLLNPGSVASVSVSGRKIDPRQFTLTGSVRAARPPARISPPPKEGSEVTLVVDSSSHNGMLAILFKPDGEQFGSQPPVGILVDGKLSRSDIQSQKGKWAWYTLSVAPGKHSLILVDSTGGTDGKWKGMEDAYFICDQSLPAEAVSVEMKDVSVDRPMPPRPAPPGTFRAYTILWREKK